MQRFAFEALEQRRTLLLLKLCEVFELAAVHTPHHVPLKIVDLRVFKLAHHLLDFPIGNQPHHRVLVLHQPHRIVVVVI